MIDLIVTNVYLHYNRYVVPFTGPLIEYCRCRMLHVTFVDLMI
jgi:hypothetical protein